MNFVKTGSITTEITEKGVNVIEADVRTEEVRAHELLRQTLPEFSQETKFTPEHYKDTADDSAVPYGTVVDDGPEGPTDYGISDAITADDLEFHQKLERENTLKELQRRRDLDDELNAFRAAKMKQVESLDNPGIEHGETNEAVEKDQVASTRKKVKSLFGAKG